MDEPGSQDDATIERESTGVADRDDEMRSWIAQFAFESGSDFVREQDVARQRHLAVAQSMTGWAQPLVLAMVGVTATPSLALSLRLACAAALPSMIATIVLALWVQKTRDWYTASFSSGVLLKNLENADRIGKTKMWVTLAERIQEYIDHNNANLRRMHRALGAAQIAYLLSPVIGVLVGLATIPAAWAWITRLF